MGRGLILIFFIILTIIQSTSIYVLTRKTDVKQVRLQNDITSLEATKQVLLKKILNTGMSTSLPFSYKNETTEDENGKKVLLRDLFNSSAKIVFRVSESQCAECIHAQIPYLSSLSKSLGKENILILGSFRSFKNLRIFMQSNDLNYKFYNIPAEDLSYLNIEMLISPYFFKVKNNLVSNVFLPEKMLNSLSEEYVKNVVANF